MAIPSGHWLIQTMIFYVLKTTAQNVPYHFPRILGHAYLTWTQREILIGWKTKMLTFNVCLMLKQLEHSITGAAKLLSLEWMISQDFPFMKKYIKEKEKRFGPVQQQPTSFGIPKEDFHLILTFRSMLYSVSMTLSLKVVKNPKRRSLWQTVLVSSTEWIWMLYWTRFCYDLSWRNSVWRP